MTCFQGDQMKKMAFICVIAAMLLGTDCKGLPGQAHFSLVSYDKTMTWYNRCLILGTVKNDGQRPGYNVKITWTAFDANNVIIDVAYGFPADLGTIRVGESATFEAPLTEIDNWARVARLENEISWLTRYN